jgi:hypothetical protein
MHDGDPVHFLIHVGEKSSLWRKVEMLRWTHFMALTLTEPQSSGLLVGVFEMFTVYAASVNDVAELQWHECLWNNWREGRDFCALYNNPQGTMPQYKSSPQPKCQTLPLETKVTSCVIKFRSTAQTYKYVWLCKYTYGNNKSYTVINLTE